MTRLIAFNKPFNVLCQFTDSLGRANLADYIPVTDVYPAGRLDFDSEGLVLLTDNGALQHQIANPRFKHWKRYWAQVEGVPDSEAVRRLRDGIALKDGVTQGAKASLINEPQGIGDRDPPIRQRASIPTRWLELQIREGRNRQVRRMTAAVGYPTLRLIRHRIGEWALDQLAPGEYRVIMAPASRRSS